MKPALPWGFLRVFFFAFFVLASISASAQKRFAPGVRHVRVQDKSDPQAMVLLSGAVAAMGGAGDWAAVHTATVEGDLSGPQAAVQHLTLTDDWSSTELRYRRENRNDKGSHVTGAGDESQRNTPVPNTVRFRKLDQARILAGHLPGAALFIVTHDQRYIALLSSLPQASPDIVNVDIYKRSSDADSRLEETWSVSKTTGLPVSVKILLPDLLRGADSGWKTTFFEAFQKYASLSIPSRTRSYLPGSSKPLVFLLTKIELNPTLSSQSFNIGGTAN